MSRNHLSYSFLTFLVFFLFQSASALYCQPDNCYELLEVSSSATPEQIKKSFRALAKRHHPDRNRQEDTTQLFQKINIAYEVLENPHTRAAYDMFLVDPSGSRAYHAYQYYKASYSPQINPIYVIGGFVLLMSWLQWVMRNQMYESAFHQIVSSRNFKIRVNEECEKDGRKGDKFYKEEVAERLKQEISIEGGYSRPIVWDLLAVQIIIFPYTFVMWIYDWCRWIIKYYIKREEYTREDAQLLTKKVLKIPKAKWEHMDEHIKSNLLAKKLWVRGNMKKYEQESMQAQLEQIKRTNPNKYRKIMAHLKKTG